jgi:hypothetical protein
MTCPHHSPAQLARFAPVPCPTCDGWVTADGQLLNRAAAIARYPAEAQLIASDPRPLNLGQALPGARTAAFWELNRIVGKLAWTLILMGISGVVLLVLILFLAHVV